MKAFFEEYAEIIVVYLFSAIFTAGFMIFYDIFSELLATGG